MQSTFTEDPRADETRGSSSINPTPRSPVDRLHANIPLSANEPFGSLSEPHIPLNFPNIPYGRDSTTAPPNPSTTSAAPSTQRPEYSLNPQDFSTSLRGKTVRTAPSKRKSGGIPLLGVRLVDKESMSATTSRESLLTSAKWSPSNRSDAHSSYLNYSELRWSTMSHAGP